MPRCLRTHEGRTHQYGKQDSHGIFHCAAPVRLKQPPMNSCPVDIWTIPLDPPRPIVLSPDEQDRASRFRFERDRLHWSHARSALRTTLALYVNRPPEELRFKCGEHGKPSLDNGAGI